MRFPLACLILCSVVCPALADDACRPVTSIIPTLMASRSADITYANLEHRLIVQVPGLRVIRLSHIAGYPDNISPEAGELLICGSEKEKDARCVLGNRSDNYSSEYRTVCLR